MGEYGEKVEVTLLTRKRNNANEANSEKIKLMNTRYAFLSEPEDGEKINVGLLKELTGSEEVVSRGLYQDSITFIMQAKLYLACNELPAIKAEDSALWRRIRVVECNSKFVENPNGDNEYLIDKTLPSRMRDDITWRRTFMNLLLQYYYKDIKEPDEVLVKTNEYRQTNNDFFNWLDEHIGIAPGKYLQISDICKMYLNKDKIHSSVSSKHRKEVEKYIKEKYPQQESEYQYQWIEEKSIQAWVNFDFK
jgi:putative DNA primase/helicase